MPSPTARCVLPTPGGPSRMTFVARSTNAMEDSSMTARLSTPGWASKSNCASVFRVLQDPLQDVPLVGVEFEWELGLRGSVVAPPRVLLEQTRHGLAVDPQFPGDGRFRKAFGEQLSNLQHILTSVHPVSSSWPSLETAFFRGGDFSFRRFCGICFRRRSAEHTSELESRENLVCRLLLEKKKIT